MQEALVGTTVIDGGKQRLLFIVIFSQEETIGRCEEIALEDAVLLAEGIHLFHLHIKSAHHRCFRMFFHFQVGHQLCEAVATVKVLCIPLLALLEGCRLTQLCLCRRHLCHCHRLGLQRTTIIHLVDVAEHHLQRRAVTNDMMDIEEEVEVFAVLEQTDVEQTVFVDVERLDERPPIKRSLLHVHRSLFRTQCERLRIVNCLQGITLLIQLYPREECRMRCHSRFDGLSQALLLQRAVKHIQIRQIITSLSLVGNTLHIETILNF